MKRPYITPELQQLSFALADCYLVLKAKTEIVNRLINEQQHLMQEDLHKDLLQLLLEASHLPKNARSLVNKISYLMNKKHADFFLETENEE